jgi:acetyl-CoA carboxylase beta subunit
MITCFKCKTEMDCENWGSLSCDSFEGEWYKCPKCGKMIFLDYEEMR